MNSHAIITATFEPVPVVVSYTLTVNIVGQGSVSPEGGRYVSGTQVSLNATPATDWQFASWSGDLSGTANPETLVMNSNKVVTATFEPVTPPCVAITNVQLSLVNPGVYYTSIPIELSAALLPLNLQMPYQYTINGAQTTSDTNPLDLALTFTKPGTQTVEIAVWNTCMTTPVTDTIQMFVKQLIYLPVVVRNAAW
jgi:hypothetical protein